MAVGFVLVAIVAVVMCGMLIALVNRVADLVDEMQADETAVKSSLALATSVREQYIHQAHWIIERDDEHLRHYKEWVERIDAAIADLRSELPDHQAQLDEIAALATQLDRFFREKIIAAIRADPSTPVAELHARADAISQRATAAADVIVRSIEGRMARAHQSASEATTLGLVAGLLCVALVVVLSFVLTWRLRRSVLAPLSVLVGAARRFGSGDFENRVGDVGDGELLALSSAFDSMASELQVRERQLIESERMAAIGQLAAGVAHEINNPIAVIRGYLRTMTSEATDETLREELQILDEEAEACQRIAEDLVAYSRPSQIDAEVAQIDELLRETGRRFGETSEGREHEIAVSADAATLEIDPTRIRQVVLNLLVNAAQVSAPDETIELDGRRVGDRYEIAVSDRGPGVPEKDRFRVFEPFFSRRSGGSGLGLAVCQGIVRAHGGRISIEDRPGGGSIFRFSLSGERPEGRR